MTILGIDPGTLRAGFGIIEWNSVTQKITVQKAGLVRLDERQALAARLRHLDSELERVFLAFRPDITVVEKIFFGRNADSAFKLGHARGICLMRVARHDSRLMEYAARAVKKTVTGNGAATKEHVRLIVTRELKYIPESLEYDVSDALALALAYVREESVRERMQQGFRREL